MTAKQWRRKRVEQSVEADPALAQGLARLRQEARLIGANAQGVVVPQELKEIQVERGAGVLPYRYDAQTSSVVLVVEPP
ncbi:MAG: hypothetical protein ACOX6T_01020, partial [Myxococcales bacterium]